MQILLDTAEGCNAASHRCHPLTISSPVGNQMWPACHVCLFRPWWTADKWTRIADTDTNLSPLCCSPFAFFWKAIWRLVLKPNCYSSCLFLRERGARMLTSPSFPSWSAALSPRGNDIMRISMPTLCLISIVNAAHTLHFGPVMVALWAALRIWQSIMSASPLTAVSCSLYSMWTVSVFVLARAALWKFEINASAVSDETTCKRGSLSIIAK